MFKHLEATSLSRLSDGEPLAWPIWPIAISLSRLSDGEHVERQVVFHHKSLSRLSDGELYLFH